MMAWRGRSWARQILLNGGYYGGEGQGVMESDGVGTGWCWWWCWCVWAVLRSLPLVSSLHLCLNNVYTCYQEFCRLRNLMRNYIDNVTHRQEWHNYCMIVRGRSQVQDQECLNLRLYNLYENGLKCRMAVGTWVDFITLNYQYLL